MGAASKIQLLGREGGLKHTGIFSPLLYRLSYLAIQVQRKRRIRPIERAFVKHSAQVILLTEQHCQSPQSASETSPLISICLNT